MFVVLVRSDWLDPTFITPMTLLVHSSIIFCLYFQSHLSATTAWRLHMSYLKQNMCLYFTHVSSQSKKIQFDFVKDVPDLFFVYCLRSQIYTGNYTCLLCMSHFVNLCFQILTRSESIIIRFCLHLQFSTPRHLRAFTESFQTVSRTRLNDLNILCSHWKKNPGSLYRYFFKSSSCPAALEDSLIEDSTCYPVLVSHINHRILMKNA